MTSPQPTVQPLSEASLNFLNQECDRMLSLYSEAQSSIQSVFNFYLTFISAVVGGILLVLQSSASGPSIQASLLLAGLMFFAAIVGIVYLSAISGRYSRAAKYSYAFDEIRRYIINKQGLEVPELYALVTRTPVKKSTNRTFSWFFPTGTYQLFIVLINSLSLAIFTGIIFSIAEADLARSAVAMVVVFGLVITILNIYSRLVVTVFSNHSVNLYHWDDNQAWAAKE